MLQGFQPQKIRRAPEHAVPQNSSSYSEMRSGTGRLSVLIFAVRADAIAVRAQVADAIHNFPLSSFANFGSRSRPRLFQKYKGSGIVRTDAAVSNGTTKSKKSRSKT
jgi:hypothetical protein